MAAGLGLHGQEVTFDTPQGEYHFDFWRKDDVMLSGHASKMVISDGDEDYKGYRMIVKGQGRIDRILLRNGGGVSAFFDDGPWSTLGKDRPVEPVEILVDATNRRAIGGSVRLEREKFWRVASHNNAHPGGLLAAEYCAERGFFPGRGIWKLDGLTHWGYGGRVLKENPKKRGVPVYSDFDGLELDVETKETREDAFPRDFKHANCFDNWPPFMALQNTRAKNHRGTPADFQEAAKLASAAIGWQKAVDGRNDFWWEVKNESTITEEWVLHGEEGVDSWGKLAEFHNIMADAIRSAHPDVLVGGPASAWMALHHADFDLARKQLRFMDETRGHLDFYSHHFYEGKELVLSAGDSYPQGYLMGRLEGCLDLLSSHMVITDNVRPFLISETGTLSDRTTELGIWLNTKNMSSYLMRYIKYPDRIDLVNLWLVPYAWWDKNGHELFNPDESGKLVVDERVGYLLELWRDFRGDRLPYRIQSQATDVHVHTVVDGKTIWVAINNLNAHRIAADISLLAGDATVQRVEQLRLYFDRAKIKFETHTRRGPDGPAGRGGRNQPSQDYFGSRATDRRCPGRAHVLRGQDDPGYRRGRRVRGGAPVWRIRASTTAGVRIAEWRLSQRAERGRERYGSLPRPSHHGSGENWQLLGSAYDRDASCAVSPKQCNSRDDSRRGRVCDFGRADHDHAPDSQ